jgi:hypothetical protein
VTNGATMDTVSIAAVNREIKILFIAVPRLSFFSQPTATKI